MKSSTVWHGHSIRPSLPAGTARKGNGHLSGQRPLHLANARPFGRLKAPLGLSLFHFAAQTRTCQGEAPPSCCAGPFGRLKGPTGAFIAPLRCANANLSGRGPSILLRKTVQSLKSPTGAFIVPLRSTNANFQISLCK